MKAAIILVVSMAIVFCPHKADAQYCNNGLRYQLKVDMASNTFISSEYSSGDSVVTPFKVTKKGNNLTVIFNGSKPIVGDATEWTSRPWILKGNKLLIPFKSKDYTTNKWRVSFSEFVKCRL